MSKCRREKRKNSSKIMEDKIEKKIKYCYKISEYRYIYIHFLNDNFFEFIFKNDNCIGLK